jgi:hypothetical protein
MKSHRLPAVIAALLVALASLCRAAAAADDRIFQSRDIFGLETVSEVQI